MKIPSEPPDLRRVGVIAIDTETKDDALAADRGSGWATRQGYVCGASVAYRAEQTSARFIFQPPSRHQQLDPAQVYTY
jgi:hypothetical protein